MEDGFETKIKFIKYINSKGKEIIICGSVNARSVLYAVGIGQCTGTDFGWVKLLKIN